MSNCINVPRIFFFAYLKKKLLSYVEIYLLCDINFLRISRHYSNFNSFVSVNIFDIAFYSV